MTPCKPKSLPWPPRCRISATNKARPPGSSTVQEQLKVLADKIAEVDRKREEDKQAIAEEIRKSMGALEKTLAASHAPSKPTPEPEPPADGKGFVYTIHPGDNLSLIIKTYNDDFKSKGLKPITLKQAEEANPDVDWNRLKVGQKIIIPRPAAAE